MIYGKEIAPSTGTPHLQGYFRGLLTYRKTISAAGTFTHSTKGQICIWSYLIPSKGTEEQNYEYCSKSGDFVEIGQKVKSLEEKIKRDDKWKKMKDDYLNLSVEDFSNKYPRESVIYRNQLKNWATDLAISNNTWPGLLPEKNFWIWGAPGVGKSRWARSQCELEFIFPKGICKWWNGYNPLIHKCIILEDFPSDGKFLAYYMKIWMDRNNFIGECKGSQIQVSPANWVFIVTSNFKIRDIFDPDDAEAIERRCSEIEFKSGSLFQATRIDFKKILKIYINTKFKFHFFTLYFLFLA